MFEPLPKDVITQCKKPNAKQHYSQKQIDRNNLVKALYAKDFSIEDIERLTGCEASVIQKIVGGEV